MTVRRDRIQILHVEDDGEFAEMTETFLEREDDRFAVEHVSSAAEGLDHLESHEVDCVVSDYEMPGRDGIEFLEAVRARWPQVPFILYTGRGSEAVASEAISAGVTDYLQKEGGTSQYAVLANRIGNAVEQYRVRAEANRRDERQRQQWDALFDLTTDETVVSGEFEPALERITETAAEVLEVPRVNVWLFDDAADRLRCVDQFDRSAGTHEQGMELVAEDYPAYFEALASSRWLRTEEPSTDPRTAELESYLEENGVRSLLDATIRSEGEVVGVVCHEQLDGAREWTDDETEFACGVAELVHRVLRNYERADRRQQLETSRARFRALARNSSHAVVTIDDDNTVQHANDAVEDVFGYAPDELVGESLMRVVPERYRSDHEAGLGRYLSSGSKQLDWDWIELPGLHKDGTEVPLGLSFGESLVDGERQFTAVIRDVEREKRRDDELEAARRRFDAVFNNPIAFMGLLEPDGSVVEVNETAAEFVDRDAGTVRGEPFWETPWWDHSEELQEQLQQWIDRAAGGELVRYESDHYACDGERVTIDGVLHPIRGADGEVVSLLAAGRDISERKEREQAIDALHGATRELIGAGSSELIAELIADTAADLLGLTHTGIHLYDEASENLEPVAWTDTVTETIGEPPSLGRESLAWEAFDAGESRVYDDLDANGETYNPDTPLRSELIVPLGRHGVVIAGAEEADAFDQNDRRLVELLCGNATAALDRLTREKLLRARERELERKNERLEQFASVLSHDLRSPLNVAMGRLELVADDCDSEHLDAVETAHERMRALIEDLLALASEDEEVSDREAVSLPAVARRSWANVETDEATLVTETDRSVPANESRLKQLFENLFRNAVEHGSTSNRTESGDAVEHGSTGSQTQSDDAVEHGSTSNRTESGDAVEHGSEAAGELRVTVGSLDDGFYVEDDGPGIPEDDRESVFEVGYSTSEDGTGFGLSIVEQVAEAHRWELRVTEGSDGGARFEVTGVETAEE